jgi:hypothetical protein
VEVQRGQREVLVTRYRKSWIDGKLILDPCLRPNWVKIRVDRDSGHEEVQRGSEWVFRILGKPGLATVRFTLPCAGDLELHSEQVRIPELGAQPAGVWRVELRSKVEQTQLWVFDEDEKPLPGASIRRAGKLVCRVNEEGHCTLYGPRGETLTVSAEGFEAQPVATASSTQEVMLHSR